MSIKKVLASATVAGMLLVSGPAEQAEAGFGRRVARAAVRGAVATSTPRYYAPAHSAYRPYYGYSSPYTTGYRGYYNPGYVAPRYYSPSYPYGYNRGGVSIGIGTGGFGPGLYAPGIGIGPAIRF